MDLGPESILLHAARSDREATYSFICPACLDDVEKGATRKIVGLLISAGVDPEDRSRHPSHIRHEQTERGPEDPTQMDAASPWTT